MSIQAYDPTGTLPTEQRGANGLEHFGESRAGILYHSGTNTKEVMELIVSRLGQKHGVIKTWSGEKPVTRGVDPAKLDELEQSADWALVGAAA